GELLRLRQHGSSVFGIGVVPEVRALVDEALSGRVDHDPERIAVFLEPIAYAQVAELGRVAIPRHGVTTRPVAAGRCADGERHRAATLSRGFRWAPVRLPRLRS